MFKYSIFKNEIKCDKILQISQEYNLMFKLLQNRISVIFDSLINTIRKYRSISKSNVVIKWETYVYLRVILNYLSFIKLETLNSWLIQAFFLKIRILYSHNSMLAESYYQEFFSNNFTPKKYFNKS